MFTGEGKDRIGPGHYEIRRDLIGKHKGTNWHASNALRTAPELVKAATETNIGPGVYEVEKASRVPVKTTPLPSSYFASKVPKPTALKKQAEADSEDESDMDSFDVSFLDSVK